MFGIIIGTHGLFSTELLKTCEMICGDQPNVRAVTLVPGEGPDDVVEKYEDAIKELGNPDRVLFLNDLLGGSPYNAACRLVVGNQNYAIVAGVNLPMLIAMVSEQITDDGSLEIDQLVEKAIAAGKDGVLSASYESLNAESDDDEL
ncbi:MAG: PTS sugar transporter subunit IIA [Selenomonadaceae bacterium]|nr:PTS sugar transporter subunit IIA [Selenomonadaceae bacterium]